MRITNNFILETLKGKKSGYKCPKCEGEHSLALYIDSETKKPINNEVGRCIHKSSCGYNNTPERFLDGKYIQFTTTDNIILSQKAIKNLKHSYFDKTHLIESENNFDKNNFVQYLQSKHYRSEVKDAIKKYRVGTSDYWKGATIFWYLSNQNKLRSGKVMLYSRKTGKRTITKGIAKIKSIRSILKEKKLIDADFVESKGLFGEHLLVDKEKPIGIVESEKTAIIASIIFKSSIWLATGKRDYLTKERLEVLKGRDVTLYPDNDAFDEWLKIAQKFNFKTSAMVNENCPEECADLADYLNQTDVKEITFA